MSHDCQIHINPGLGCCCCNCAHQVLISKHPWNVSFAKGSIMDILGAVCVPPDMQDGTGRPRGVFFDGAHGMCEMHDHYLTGAPAAAKEA